MQQTRKNVLHSGDDGKKPIESPPANPGVPGAQVEAQSSVSIAGAEPGPGKFMPEYHNRAHWPGLLQSSVSVAGVEPVPSWAQVVGGASGLGNCWLQLRKPDETESWPSLGKYRSGFCS